MRTSLKILLLTGALGMMALGAPRAVRADHHPYWRGYWGWYNGSYVPYYRSYSYYNAYPYNYGPAYGAPPAYYAPAPYVSGYYAAPGVGVQVGVGPRVRYGWW